MQTSRLPSTFFGFLLAGLAVLFAPFGQAQDLEVKIGTLAKEMLKADLTVGLVIGTIKDGQTWAQGYGVTSPETNTIPDQHTVYEIGSISKVFTGILLADATESGLVALDDPAATHLPEAVSFPQYEDTPIHLQDLSTHTSGLPRMPPDFAPSVLSNPYADYDVTKLYVSLGKIRLERAPKAQYEYSNLAVGLLGHILVLKHKKDNYQALLVERILTPLDMQDTRVQFTDAMKARLAPPYDSGGRARSNWDLDALAGAGAIRSTVADLLKFAQANLQPEKTKLAKALQAAQITREKGSGKPEIGLGWHKTDAGKTLWHNGGTGGYRAFMALDPEKQIAVVVLANTTASQVDEVGRNIMKLLRGEEAPDLETRKAVEVGRDILQSYVGTYEFAPGLEIAVTLEEKGLAAQVTGQESYRIYATSETRFFWRVVPAECTFEVDENGQATALILHQGGIDQRAMKVK